MTALFLSKATQVERNRLKGADSKPSDSDATAVWTNEQAGIRRERGIVEGLDPHPRGFSRGPCLLSSWNRSKRALHPDINLLDD